MNFFSQPIYSMILLDENTFATGDDDGTVKCNVIHLSLYFSKIVIQNY